MSEFGFLAGIGGFIFDVRSLYYNTKYTCRDYLLPPTPEIVPDAVIAVTREMLEAELALCPYEWVREEGASPQVVESYLEKNALFRSIGDFVSHHKAAVFHGVLLELAGEGYLFTAKSGTGKTTHALNWLKAFPEARIINGDKPILRLEGDRLVGYGTPWCGKEHFQHNEKVPVKAVIRVERGEANRIEPYSGIEMLPTWLMQTHRPQDAEAMKRVTETALEMMGRAKLFCLHCNMDMESALVAKQGIDGGEPHQ